MRILKKACRTFAMTAIPAIALGLSASAANAAPPPPVTPTTNPCHDVYVQGAIACQGYYGGNLFQGSAGAATPADVQAVIALLLGGTATTGDGLPTDNGSSYSPPYNLDYDTILGAISGQTDGDNTFDFSPLGLTGLTIFGAHFGNNTDGGDSQNISAIWLLDLGNTTTSIVTLADGQGVSNAQIFATGGGGALPEPATWAMMLIGFGAVGVSMRRSRRKTGLISQLA